MVAGLSNLRLVHVLGDMRSYIVLPHNDFGFSGWRDRDHALAEYDGLARAVEAGDGGKLEDLALLFAPTGRLQELSMASGWADAYISLAEQFDAATADMRS